MLVSPVWISAVSKSSIIPKPSESSACQPVDERHGQSNTRGEPPPEAGATQERTLEAVGYSARLCEKSIFSKIRSNKINNLQSRYAPKRGFHTVWCLVRRGLGQQGSEGGLMRIPSWASRFPI